MGSLKMIRTLRIRNFLAIPALVSQQIFVSVSRPCRDLLRFPPIVRPPVSIDAPPIYRCAPKPPGQILPVRSVAVATQESSIHPAVPHGDGSTATPGRARPF